MLHLELLNSSKTALLILALVLATTDTPSAANEPFRFTGLNLDLSPAPTETTRPSSSSLVWQPLRATFRPLNRAAPSSERPAELSLAGLDSQPSTGGASAASSTVSSLIESAEDLEEQPTRVPLSRFRPTKAPSVDPPEPAVQPARGTHSFPIALDNSSLAGTDKTYRISSECFECICESSTNCNLNSRCQTSDVRHTRCGLFLVSYDQWLETGLSKQLVTREALAKDPAADERAFYECVTNRSCAERVISIYMDKHLKDCDKDGRMDCYDVAAIHQGGPSPDQCQSESLLDSQYWSDFNACFGFGR